MTDNKNFKTIKGDLNINGNLHDGFALSFPTETADKLCALYKEAADTVLKGIEEEDQYVIFDKWLKEKEPALYDVAMNEFSSQICEALMCEPLGVSDGYLDDGHDPYDLDGLQYDGESFYWFDSNEIAIESFSEQ